MARDHAGLEPARLGREPDREPAVVGLRARERHRPAPHARIIERAQVVAHLERTAQRHRVPLRGRELRDCVGRGAGAPDERGRAQAREPVAVRVDERGGALHCVGGGPIHVGW